METHPLFPAIANQSVASTIINRLGSSVYDMDHTLAVMLTKECTLDVDDVAHKKSRALFVELARKYGSPLYVDSVHTEAVRAEKTLLISYIHHYGSHNGLLNDHDLQSVSLYRQCLVKMGRVQERTFPTPQQLKLKAA